MKDIYQGFEIFLSAPFAIAVSIVATIAKQAHHGWQGSKKFIRELIINIFVGMMLAWGMDGSGYPMGLQGAIIGGGAFAASTLIDPFLNKLVSLINEWHFGNGRSKE